MIPPKGIIDLYREAQVNADMDSGTYIGGTDHYGVDQIIEAIAPMCSWHLPPRMTRAQREDYLREIGQDYNIEFLGVYSD
jgi:hypothetical protein